MTLSNISYILTLVLLLASLSSHNIHFTSTVTQSGDDASYSAHLDVSLFNFANSETSQTSTPFGPFTQSQVDAYRIKLTVFTKTALVDSTDCKIEYEEETAHSHVITVNADLDLENRFLLMNNVLSMFDSRIVYKQDVGELQADVSGASHSVGVYVLDNNASQYVNEADCEEWEVTGDQERLVLL